MEGTPISANHHTPIVDGASNAASTWNTPMGQLDAAINTANTARAAGDQTLQDALDALIVESGTSDAETIGARTAIRYLAGSPPATLGAALALAAGNLYNVLAYGAVGDGTTDDSTAVAAAFTAAGAGDTVYFPPGYTYLFNATVSTGSDVRVLAYGATLKVGTATPLSITGDNVTVEGATFLGTATDHTVVAVGGEGLYIDATAARSNIRIRHCDFEWLGRGIWFVSPDPVDNTILLKNILISDCTFRDLTENAIAVRKAGATQGTNYHVRQMRVADCHFEDIYYPSPAATAALHWAAGSTIEKLAVANCSFKNCAASAMLASGAATVNGCVISGCTVDGSPASGATWYQSMGLDLSYMSNVAISGCVVENVSEECLTLFGIENFAVSGCTFANGNVGIGVYVAGTTPSNGTINGCTFVDMEDPSGANSARTGVLLAKGSAVTAYAHRVKINGCTFELGAAAAGNSIVLQDIAHPATVVSACEFNGTVRGIYLMGAIAHTVTVQGCTFTGCTTAAITAAGTMAQSTIANNLFSGCAYDIVSATSTNVRCVGNIHDSPTSGATRLQNNTGCSVTNSTFNNVSSLVSGVGSIGIAYPLIWANNTYTGTTSAPSTNNGYITLDAYGNKTFKATAAPTTGTWARGDIALEDTPASGAAWGWICTAAGTPGTWETLGFAGTP